MNFDKYLIPNDYWDKVVSLNKKLTSFHYGIPLDQFNSSSRVMNPYDENKPGDFFFKNYRYLSPEEFEKYEGGICWDYVCYEAKFFKDNIGYPFKCFYVVIDNKQDCPTHTFLVFQKDDKYFLFESSFKAIAGMWVSNSEKDIINFILYNMNRYPGTPSGENLLKFPIYMCAYNPNNEKIYGYQCAQFMEYMSTLIKRWNYSSSFNVRKVV